MSAWLFLGRFARALRNRNFTLYICGNTISLIGMWMQRMALGWLTWELTHSSVWLGVMAFADLFPTMVISPLAGAMADRQNRLRSAQVLQYLSILQALVLAGLVFSDRLTISVLLGLTVVQGIIVSFWQPVRLALLPSLVRADDLASAVAINAVIFNVARFIGPLLAGLVILQGSIGWAFLGNALSYCAMLAALCSIHLPPAAASRRGSIGADIVAGYVYAMRHPGIGPLLILVTATCVLLRPVAEFLPGFAATVFSSGAAGLSALASALGAGAIVGGIWLGQRERVAGLTQLVLTHTFGLCLTLILFAASEQLWLGMLCIALAGAQLVIVGAGGQTLVQTAVAAEMRGRVMALYGMIFRGGVALGALLLGALSAGTGLQWALVCACLPTLAIAWRLRGKLPTMQPGLESA